MGTADNKALITKIMDGGDMGEMFGLLADDGKWTVVGSTVFSGTFDGKDDFMARLVGPLVEQMESMGSTTLDNIVAEGDHVVVQSRATGWVTKTGRPYDNTYCIVSRFRDGQIVNVDEYCDTELVTSAFGPPA